MFVCAPSLTVARAAMHKLVCFGKSPVGDVSWPRALVDLTNINILRPIPGTCIWIILHQNTQALLHHASMIVATRQRCRIKYLQNGALGFVCISTFKVHLTLIYNVSSKRISMTLIWTITMSNLRVLHPKISVGWGPRTVFLECFYHWTWLGYTINSDN